MIVKDSKARKQDKNEKIFITDISRHRKIRLSSATESLRLVLNSFIDFYTSQLAAECFHN